jgi:ferric-dicitrate binding protein FerR (iron transport regulator)
MSEEQRIWTLLARKLSSEATEEEQRELEELLRHEPSWQYTYEMLSAYWSAALPSAEGEGTGKAVQELHEKILKQAGRTGAPAADEETTPPWELPRARHDWGKRWVIAAMVVVLLGSGLLLRYYRPQPATATADSYAGGGTNEITTRYGSKTKVTLPDGTIVWINSGSKLSYNNRSFGINNRQVTLVGEGFFDVAHDAVHPFIIQAGKINVKVLGTSFDIKSYPEDKTVEATLLKGSIEVTITDQPQKSVLLKPHEKLTVFNDDRMVTQNLDALKPDADPKGYKITPLTFIPSDSTVVETSWVQNKLAFRSEAFADLAVQMERWYNVHINFSDGKVKQYRFTGIFVNESLDQALKALQITAPFHYRIEKNQVYISKP